MKKYPVRCPVTTYLHIMEGHWKPIIIWYLREAPLRFNILLQKIPDISSRVLTEELKDLESNTIIQRVAYKEMPPRVEYQLTLYGATLLPALTVLREWGLQHLTNNPHLLHPDSEWNDKIKKIKSGDKKKTVKSKL